MVRRGGRAGCGGGGCGSGSTCLFTVTDVICKLFGGEAQLVDEYGLRDDGEGKLLLRLDTLLEKAVVVHATDEHADGLFFGQVCELALLVGAGGVGAQVLETEVVWALACRGKGGHIGVDGFDMVVGRALVCVCDENMLGAAVEFVVVIAKHCFCFLVGAGKDGGLCAELCGRGNVRHGALHGLGVLVWRRRGLLLERGVVCLLGVGVVVLVVAMGGWEVARWVRGVAWRRGRSSVTVGLVHRLVRRLVLG